MTDNSEPPGRDKDDSTAACLCHCAGVTAREGKEGNRDKVHLEDGGRDKAHNKIEERGQTGGLSE